MKNVLRSHTENIIQTQNLTLNIQLEYRQNQTFKFMLFYLGFDHQNQNRNVKYGKEYTSISLIRNIKIKKNI